MAATSPGVSAVHGERRRCGRPGTCLERQARLWLAAAAASLMACAAGCSSGSESQPTPTPNSIVVTVSATDVFGAPVAGARITIYPDAGSPVSLVADDDGRAEIAGDYRNVLGVSASSTDLYGASYEPQQSADNRLEFIVVMHPSAALTSGWSVLPRGGASRTAGVFSAPLRREDTSFIGGRSGR